MLAVVQVRVRAGTLHRANLRDPREIVSIVSIERVRARGVTLREVLTMYVFNPRFLFV